MSTPWRSEDGEQFVEILHGPGVGDVEVGPAPAVNVVQRMRRVPSVSVIGGVSGRPGRGPVNPSQHGLGRAAGEHAVEREEHPRMR